MLDIFGLFNRFKLERSQIFHLWAFVSQIQNDENPRTSSRVSVANLGKSFELQLWNGWGCQTFCHGSHAFKKSLFVASNVGGVTERTQNNETFKKLDQIWLRKNLRFWQEIEIWIIWESHSKAKETFVQLLCHLSISNCKRSPAETGLDWGTFVKSCVSFIIHCCDKSFDIDICFEIDFSALVRLNLKILLLVRDPRGTMHSRLNLEWCMKSSECNSTTRLCDDLVSDYKALIQLDKKYPGRIRYQFSNFSFGKKFVCFWSKAIADRGNCCLFANASLDLIPEAMSFFFSVALKVCLNKSSLEDFHCILLHNQPK